MSKVILTVVLLMSIIQPVSALEITAPEVPPSAEAYMPDTSESFGQGLLEIFQDAIMLLRPDIKEASVACLGVIAAAMLVSLLDNCTGSVKKSAELIGTVVVAGMLLAGTKSLIRLGADTVAQMSEYGKLLLPVMTAALAAQGGISSSGALYAGTVAFDTVLTSLIKKLMIPMLYLYLAMVVANSAVGEDAIKKLRDLLKWAMTWALKIILYVFTGYMGITGVVTGTTDAAALKATKLTISGMVPVVGGILSDASEAILVSAGTVKNAAGIYGIFAILAMCLEPFLKIGVHYLMLKATGAIASVFAPKKLSGLITDFSGAMGMLLAVTGSVCLMLLISIVCFLKGVG